MHVVMCVLSYMYLVKAFERGGQNLSNVFCAFKNIFIKIFI